MTRTPRFGLVCFDVDGTLVRHPRDKVIWEVLNLRFTGSDAVNRERLRMYQAGEITYADWVALDVQSWIDAGATRDAIVEAVREFSLFEGALETVWELRRRGAHLAVISGTLDVVVETLFPDHPFGDVFTNRLRFDDRGVLVGWEATPYDLHGKPDAVRAVAARHGVALERCAFVGDGENDVPVIGVVGYFVAFNPRSDELARRANVVLRGESMERLLEML